MELQQQQWMREDPAKHVPAHGPGDHRLHCPPIYHILLRGGRLDIPGQCVLRLCQGPSTYDISKISEFLDSTLSLSNLRNSLVPLILEGTPSPTLTSYVNGSPV